MRFGFLERITIEKSLIYIIIGAVLITFSFIFYLFFSHFSKSIRLDFPSGKEELEIGETYQITWRAKGIENIGIVLFKGNEPKWIAKNVNAKAGKYNWKIYPGQEYGDNYWIAVFEYPWRKGNKIDYSNGAFAIVFPSSASCEPISVEKEWPYLSSDFPNLRRVFITSQTYTGDLGGLEGADQKCQEEAESRGLEGKWHAFVGGDNDNEVAVARLNETPRKTDGVFVEGEAAVTLPARGATCHRLLGKDFDEFLTRLSSPSVINEQKLSSDFFANLKEVWLGRIKQESKKNCIEITGTLADAPLQEKYSFSTTCQNWTKENKYVQGYPVSIGTPKPPFPTCYTPQGVITEAVGSGGLSSGTEGRGLNENFTPSQGRYCDTRRHLLCIEE